MNNSTADRRSPLGLLKVTMVYTHGLNEGGRGVHSLLDRLRMGLSVESRGIMRPEASG